MDKEKDELNEQEEKLLSLLDREKSLTSVCSNLNLNKYEVLGLVSHIRENGQNIIVKRLDDDIYLINHGEREIRDKNTFSVNTDLNNEFKFVAFSARR